MERLQVEVGWRRYRDHGLLFTLRLLLSFVLVLILGEERMREGLDARLRPVRRVRLEHEGEEPRGLEPSDVADLVRHHLAVSLVEGVAEVLCAPGRELEQLRAAAQPIPIVRLEERAASERHERDDAERPDVEGRVGDEHLLRVDGIRDAEEDALGVLGNEGGLGRRVGRREVLGADGLEEAHDGIEIDDAPCAVGHADEVERLDGWEGEGEGEGEDEG